MSHTQLLAEIKDAARKIVEFLLSDGAAVEERLDEARVYRSPGCKIWQGVFTGPQGGPIWKSTGLTNKRQAMLVVRRWEAQARAEREKQGRTAGKALVRAGQGIGLSQEEVALALKLSVRSVRAIEKRAVKKLLANLELRQTWQDYLSGQLDEDQLRLTPQEIEALYGLARTNQELLVLRRILGRIQL